MGRIGTAFRAFFGALGSSEVASRIDAALAGTALPGPALADVPKPAEKPAAPAPPARSDAISLLAALQREARFIDFIQEPLGDCDDAMIGVVARDVHRDCRKAIERWFSLLPALQQAEGSQVEVPPGFDAARFRLTGNVTGQPPFTGELVHHGWQATRCELPTWTGGHDAVMIVAPVEVELK
ncbi:MAG: DUF2760 domain-containing protein [Pirellulales bacterium]